jgi:hypothetical protein
MTQLQLCNKKLLLEIQNIVPKIDNTTQTLGNTFSPFSFATPQLINL